MKEKKQCKPLRGSPAYGWDYACGEMVKTQTRTYGLCINCRNKWAATTEAGGEYLRSKIIPRAKKEVKEKTKAKEKKDKKRLIDYSKKLQETINKIARQIDYGLPCLAKEYYPNQMHAGHIFSRGAERSMRYNLHNIHRQSAQSNWKQNEDGLLREKLRQEYGEEYYEFLSNMRQTPPLKFTNQEFEELNIKANQILRDIKSKEQIFIKPMRIILRNTINAELGIYPKKFQTFNVGKIPNN